MFCFTLAAYAVPARPGHTRQLTLDDGTTVTACLVGDEYGHYWLAQDGKAYLKDGDTYRLVDRQAIQESARASRDEANERRAKRLAPAHGKGQNNYTGHKKGLIILVDFQDMHFRGNNDQAMFYRLANEKNLNMPPFQGSVHDYFYDQSGGKFQLDFDVVGPFTLSREFSFYGKNDRRGKDINAGQMVIEALKLADSQVYYPDYDWNGNGVVDQVLLVYAGLGEEDGGPEDAIWAHEFTLSRAYLAGDGGGAQFLDGVIIDTYACSCELNSYNLINGIGTMCHEFSHCLGFPDFYDKDYSGGQGMINWDLMDEGSNNNSGYKPCGYTSYERWVAGWQEPIELSSTTSVSNMKSLQDGGEFYIIYNNGHPDEFFLMENRQKTGWDADIPGAGLLILHVDYDRDVWLTNSVNDDPGHQRMTWIPADNKYQSRFYSGNRYYTREGAANDPFPYDSINAFNANTTPAAIFYNLNSDGTYYLDSSVEDITQNSDGTISFLFVGSTSDDVRPIRDNIGASTGQWYNLGGQPLDGTPVRPGIHLNSNGQKVMIRK